MAYGEKVTLSMFDEKVIANRYSNQVGFMRITPDSMTCRRYFSAATGSTSSSSESSSYDTGDPSFGLGCRGSSSPESDQ